MHAFNVRGVCGVCARVAPRGPCAQAGPGTIAEAMCRSLPTMLSCYLPGQEAGNIPFVVDGGFGAYSKQPKEIAATVAKWMSDDELVRALTTQRPKSATLNKRAF